jgi:hypothetical protein
MVETKDGATIHFRQKPDPGINDDYSAKKNLTL